MELATAALGSLLPKLGTLLSDRYKLHKGVRGEIRFLQAEMESMQAVLHMLSQLPPHHISELDKIWMRNLKELSYDIEDSVDIFMVRINTPKHTKPHSFRRFFDRTIGLLTKAKIRHRIADDIQDIKRRIQEVAARRERYNNVSHVAPHTEAIAIDPRMSALYVDVENLVGTDGPAEEISNLLTQGKGVQKQKLLVSSIVGVGGLGKTTIANLVYKSLGGQFDCKAFVSVSLRPNMKQILSKILVQVSDGMWANSGEMDLDELVTSIRKCLNDKRYFIVIDDVWSKEAWKFIKNALIDNNLCSRVIVTTRNADVADSCSSDGAMYELDPLSEEDSKRLLSTRIFNEEEGIHSGLEEVTKKILKKCGGVPLAIITIASMLANKPDKTKVEWYRIYKSMGSGLEKDNSSLGHMREILYFSYADLPAYLKPCLLYLSMFPEDYEINRERLVQRWVAEGFVEDKPGRTLYDVGEMYFNELVNRNMIQAGGIDRYGSAEYCRVHDMILDLIISLSDQENFITISEGPELTSRECKIRRLSLQGSEVQSYAEDSKEQNVIVPAKANVTHVRSLIEFGGAFRWMPTLSRFSVLRVLDLEQFPSKNNHPKDLGSLHHLRFLALGGELKAELLEEIGNLRLLKILDLLGANGTLRELPTSIVQLTQLEYLLVSGYVKLPDGIKNLRSLQELCFTMNYSPNILAELGNLTELRHLSIGLNERHMKNFLQTLSNLSNLRTLSLSGEGPCSLDCISYPWRSPVHLQGIDGHIYFPIYQLPRWFSSLYELSCLTITIKVLRQDDLQMLGALPALRFLELVRFVDLEVRDLSEERFVIDNDHPFHSLVAFNFLHYPRCWLVFDQKVMPKLQQLFLHLSAWKRDGGISDIGFENLASLKHVTLQVGCMGARLKEVEDVETKIRDTIGIHPNKPTLRLKRSNEMYMEKDDSEQQSSDSLISDDLSEDLEES